MRIYSRLHCNCQIIIGLDRVQSKMGVGYSFTDKLLKRNYERNSCIIERIMRYKMTTATTKQVRYKCLIDM